jgi:hypothetical protein
MIYVTERDLISVSQGLCHDVSSAVSAPVTLQVTAQKMALRTVNPNLKVPGFLYVAPYKIYIVTTCNF